MKKLLIGLCLLVNMGAALAGYPWGFQQPLTSSDLNAAFAARATFSRGPLLAHGVLIGNGLGDLYSLGALGPQGWVLTSNGPNADPSFQLPLLVPYSNSQPVSPVLGQLWLNIGTTPYTLEEYDGGAFVPVGRLDSVAHVWYTQVGSGGTGLTSAGASGNVLTSTGSGWASLPPATAGTVTTMSVVSANGLAGTVATATSTPAITFTTTVNSPCLQGNGTALSGCTVTGSGGTMVESNSPTLIAPNLGTPSTLVGTNISGTASALTAGNVTTNANLTGVITSVGNATSIGAQTGTGSTFAMSNGPTFIAPNLGTPASGNLANTAGYPPCTATTAGVVPTPPNNTTTFLRGDCTFASAGAGASNYVTKTTTYSANAGDFIMADTSGGAWTLTLPASPAVYNLICIVDASGTFGTNTLTIGNNSLKIMGTAASMTVTTAYASFCLIYYNSTYGWRIQ